MSSNREQTSINVHIAGVDLSLKSDEDTDYINRIAQYVEAKILNISTHSKVKSQAKIALLVALQIADELHRLQRQCDAAERELTRFETLSKELCDNVDAQLARLTDTEV